MTTTKPVSGTLSATRTAATAPKNSTNVTPIGAKAFDFLVYVGRFQPFHAAHKAIVDQALSVSENVILLVGSSRQPRNARNPWTFDERCQMILAAYPDAATRARLHFRAVPDFYNNQAWIHYCQTSVRQVAEKTNPAATRRMGLIGCQKDHTGYFLRMFPDYQSVNMPHAEGIDATHIRADYFKNPQAALTKLAAILPPSTIEYLQAFAVTPDYQYIADEVDFLAKYKQQWASLPFAPVFMTVDAVVMQAGHVLMVRRKAKPGEGLLALPGGFIKAESETLDDAVLRIIKDETRLKVPPAVLAGSITTRRIFDHPNRSNRGRTITQAYLIQLRDDPDGLPKVQAGGEASAAKWISLADLNPEQIFEDHWQIIRELTGVSPSFAE